jgi:peptide chain release factor subunit 1
MAVTSKQKHSLKKFINQLKEYSGRHTELVSVYVPAGYQMIKIIQHLQQEQGTAMNIKSAATRKNVTAALERMIQHLKIVETTPVNGLAVFAGNISEREGRMDVQVWSVEPPLPLNIRLYRCDKNFVTEPLEDMMDTKEVYGLVVMDRREGTIGLLKGKTIIPLHISTSNVPGKTKAGGQSAHRFAQLRENAALDFFKRIAEVMKKEFLGKKELKGILVGGPGPTKHDFIDNAQITTEVKNKIIAVKDIGYTDESGLYELVEKCQDVLAKEELAVEKDMMNKFFKALAEDPGKVAYGEAHVKAALEMGAVDILLVSESLDDKLFDEYEEKAKATGCDMRVISVETREGVQLKDMGGIAALLRFALS